MLSMGDAWSLTGSALASFVFVWTIAERFLPYYLRDYIHGFLHKLFSRLYPYVRITFHEFIGHRFNRSENYVMIQSYLRENSASTAKKLKADDDKGKKLLLLSMDDHEEVAEEYEGVKVWWQSNKKSPRTSSFSFYPATEDPRYYKLTFHVRHRSLITERYIPYVLREGKTLSVENRQRKLYTNNPTKHSYYTNWSHVPFEHPATFDTLAMTEKRKQEIKDDLNWFSRAEDYYKKIGKPWKRGYLLYGPPGTGKSTMIAAMANWLKYDVYDLELTTVKDNTELRRLLIDTSSKSIIVIEDIDCSLNLTGQRKDKKKKDEDEAETEKAKKKAEKQADEQESKVTLSGLLNFIDGLWSGCKGERIIIFTTNFVEKLDPALVRRGRMDVHLEMSYCSFEAFEVLAKNYLEVASVHGYAEIADIKKLLGEIKISPADVAEYLLPKVENEEIIPRLDRLIEALRAAKEEQEKAAAAETTNNDEEEERERMEREAGDKEKRNQTEEGEEEIAKDEPATS